MLCMTRSGTIDVDWSILKLNKFQYQMLQVIVYEQHYLGRYTISTNLFDYF